jgi:D-glycero-D-manno-heptose 1,7-bisphosphate phosphatase
MAQGGRAAVFLDRDGVLNWDDGYTHRIEDFRILPGVVEELKRLHSLGFLLVVITNQAGIARGYYTEQDYEAFTAHLRSELAAQGVVLDAVYHCPHHPEGTLPQYAVDCDCRKPKPGMIVTAMRDHGIDASQSWLVGDKLSDVQAGVAAGIPKSQCLLVDNNAGLGFVAGLIGALHGHGTHAGR